MDVGVSPALQIAERLLQWGKKVNSPDRLRLHFVGNDKQNALFRQAQQTAPERIVDALLCHKQKASSDTSSVGKLLKTDGHCRQRNRQHIRNTRHRSRTRRNTDKIADCGNRWPFCGTGRGSEADRSDILSPASRTAPTRQEHDQTIWRQIIENPSASAIDRKGD